jgi:hypothetical protein
MRPINRWQRLLHLRRNGDRGLRALGPLGPAALAVGAICVQAPMISGPCVSLSATRRAKRRAPRRLQPACYFVK